MDMRKTARTHKVVSSLVWLALPFWAVVWATNRNLALPERPAVRAPVAPEPLVLVPPWECRRLQHDLRQSLAGCPTFPRRSIRGHGPGDFPHARPLDRALAERVPLPRPAAVLRFGAKPATGDYLGI